MPGEREVARQLVILTDALAQGLGDPVHLMEQHPASAGRWSRSRAVARASRASTYAGRAGASRDGGGTSSCTVL